MRKLTQKEIDDAPNWAVSYNVEVNSVGTDYIVYHERHYGFTLPLSPKTTSKEFNVNGAWVSVKDRLPPKTKSATWSDDDVLILCLYSYEIGRTRNNVWVGMDNSYIENVTHWQPLPEPPKPTAEDLL
jgi:hypothetical protein